jgi:hypothetical protein
MGTSRTFWATTHLRPGQPTLTSLSSRVTLSSKNLFSFINWREQSCSIDLIQIHPMQKGRPFRKALLSSPQRSRPDLVSALALTRPRLQPYADRS